jgi:hypothetical protein
MNLIWCRLFAAVIGIGACLPNAALAQVSAQSGKAMEVQNLASAFVSFWDQTKELTADARVAAFKRDVEPRFPAFYGIARYGGKVSQAKRDAQILRAIEKFGPTREAFVAKVSDFEIHLEANLLSFRQAFPDFQPDVAVYLLHSLGEMDGGTRSLEGKQYLIFGADGMVQYHKSTSDESAFFHHELFHILHRPLLGTCEEIWCSLWREGLAVHVAKTMHPQASEDELLLTFPPDLVKNTEAKRRDALIHLKGVLSSTDEDAYSAIFQSRGDTTGLPPRRGYVLGLWVAQEIAKSHSLQALSKMNAERAKPLVFAAVDALIARSTP